MPFTHKTELIGYHDLNKRPGFKMAMQEVDGRFFIYVASLWEPGLSILEVSDPAQPRFLRYLEGPPNTWTIQTQVADQIMITALEHVPPSWASTSNSDAPPHDGFIIWDVSEPDNPKQMGEWKSGSTGTHRNFYAGGNVVHATAALPGYEGQVYASVDISDPTQPQLLGTWHWPGQHKSAGEQYSDLDIKRLTMGRPFPTKGPKQHNLSLHGGPYVFGDRAYCGWMRAGLVILDISDVTTPRAVSNLPFYPPLGSSIASHTAVPLPDRNLVIVNSEALNEAGAEPVNYAGLVDISDESDPVLISLFPQPQVPPGYPARTFFARGGRFGPHNQHQPQCQKCLQPSGELVYMTYFNAGLQIFDISDPLVPFIHAYYIPDDPVERRGPLPTTLVPSAEDVLVDRRGVIYITDKNFGLHIIGLEGQTQVP